MFSRIARSSLSKQGNQLRFLQTSKSVRKATAMPVELSSEKEEKKSWSTTLVDRFTVTAEVAVSKLLPAGMGWQGFSCLAEGMGLGATDAGFFLITGSGDALGVAVGHTLYYTIKKNVYDQSIDLKQQAQAALLLGTATFCSGAAWQPAVNMFQGLETSFVTAAVGTGVITGSMFFTGLRLGRTMYGNMDHIEKGNSDNLAADAKLSAAIGGATAAFVGTDVSYGDENFLRPVVGIEESMGAAEGIMRAGLSTMGGFTAAQTVQNVTFPRGKNWLD